MTIIIIITIAALLALSALFAATETAITASSPGKMHKLKSEGDKKAAIVLTLLKTKEKVISTMLIGNSLINTICTTIATGLFINLLGKDIGTIISSVVMAFLIIVFAEVVPKAIAVAKAETIVLATATTITFFLKILRPINAILDLAVKIFCFIFRINLKQEISGTDEVRGIIEHHHHEGHVYKNDRDMLGGVLDISDMSVSEIMVHRSSITTIDANQSNKEIVSIALASPHTRIPLWQDSKDNIIGILHIKDLLRSLYDNNNDIQKINIKKILTPPWFVPEHAQVSQQLNLFRERKNHFACVVDEYGDLQGIITLEDILEEIVGQIHDEHDNFSDSIIVKGNSEYIIHGSTSIRDINRELNWNLPDDDANTIAGLIIHESQHIPNQGEILEVLNLEITIQKKLGNKIELIKAKVLSDRDEQQ